MSSPPCFWEHCTGGGRTSGKAREKGCKMLYCQMPNSDYYRAFVITTSQHTQVTIQDLHKNGKWPLTLDCLLLMRERDPFWYLCLPLSTHRRFHQVVLIKLSGSPNKTKFKVLQLRKVKIRLIRDEKKVWRESNQNTLYTGWSCQRTDNKNFNVESLEGLSAEAEVRLKPPSEQEFVTEEKE